MRKMFPNVFPKTSLTTPKTCYSNIVFHLNSPAWLSDFSVIASENWASDMREQFRRRNSEVSSSLWRWKALAVGYSVSMTSEPVRSRFRFSIRFPSFWKKSNNDLNVSWLFNARCTSYKDTCTSYSSTKVFSPYFLL